MSLPTSSLHMMIEFVIFYITAYKHLHFQKYIPRELVNCFCAHSQANQQTSTQSPV